MTTVSDQHHGVEPLGAAATVLTRSPHHEASLIGDAYAEGDLSPVEALRQLHRLLRVVDSVLTPLQEARDLIRTTMERPLLAAGGRVELRNEAMVTWVEPAISERYDRGKVDQLVAELATQGEPLIRVAAQLAALKQQTTRAGFVKVERPRAPQPASETPPF